VAEQLKFIEKQKSDREKQKNTPKPYPWVPRKEAKNAITK
jgi:hypothetical protein